MAKPTERPPAPPTPPSAPKGPFPGVGIPGKLGHDASGSDPHASTPTPEKRRTVAELAEAFGDAESVLITHYRGLSVATIKRLRAQIREHAEYRVVKNTLAHLAAQEAGLPDVEFTGATAVALVHQETPAVARALRDFAREFPALVITGGVLEGRSLTPEQVDTLADIEPRERLLARFAASSYSLLASPARSSRQVLTKPAALFQAVLDKSA
jgi:large subunit ribosomal protein L10